ncbi:MAG: alpha/beta hydrolase [Candidatus Marinimicrobia bacterium]|nr:alpha/beta hydrolase [Candidatus Neomarinimicrobiota bacterium]
MHDGQNIIDPFTSFAGQDWRMDEVVTELIELGKIDEIIIVGINNTDNRTAEYSPLHLGEQYSAFMINTLKPFIDSTYRTIQKPEHTAVMGSSMGGIISFHLVWEYPQTFSMAGCLSPAFLIDDNEIINRIRNYSGPEKSIKLYIDNGTIGLEQRLQPAIDELVPLLNQTSFTDEHHLLYYIADGAEHDEIAWAERVHLPLVFFFGR